MRLPLALPLLLAVAGPARAQLTIRLTSAPPPAPGESIHVAGSFNGWNPAAPGSALVRGPDGVWVITLPDSVRGAVEFKFALGSWQRVEVTASGGDVTNHALVIPPTGAMDWSASVAAWKSGADAPKRSTASRSVHVLTDSFAMPQLGRRRRVWIYLPPGYATSRRRYPVLYMHDGQNVFDAATSFSGEWGVDETLDSLHAQGDPGAIVVAVDNGGDHRMDEYDPWKSARPTLGGGEGGAYVEFLVHTLKPYVDRHFRTRRDAAHTAIAGSSMGGLISFYAAMAHPETFGRAAVFSCACWVARPMVYAWPRTSPGARRPPRLYFVAGALETADGEPARDQREMVDTLAAIGVPGARVRATIAEDGKHAEWFWRREFPAAYRWLFADERHDGRR